MSCPAGFLPRSTKAARFGQVGNRFLGAQFPDFRYHTRMQNEITISDALLDGNGRLKHKGYARRPLLHYNPQNISIGPFGWFNFLRLKEWDYYGVTGPDYFFAAAVSTIGYAGVIFAYVIDFNTMTMTEDTVLTFLGKGVSLPKTSEEGDIYFQHPKVRMSFVRLAEERLLKVDWPGFGGKGLTAHLSLIQPKDMDGIVMATPIGDKGFYYNHKVNCMPAEGDIVFAGKKYKAQRSDTMGTLDWGRGVWAYDSFWNWASLSAQLPDGRAIGLNLGHGFGDLSAASENAAFVDGRIVKFEKVNWRYSSNNYMDPWNFKSPEGRVALTMTPIFHRQAKFNFGVIASEVHQMFGRYSGRIDSPEFGTIEINDLLGWAEEHRARW